VGFAASIDKHCGALSLAFFFPQKKALARIRNPSTFARLSVAKQVSFDPDVGMKRKRETQNYLPVNYLIFLFLFLKKLLRFGLKRNALKE
jgi:hypothetical protein